MPLIDLLAALGLLVAVALGAVTVLTALLFGLRRLELATVPVRDARTTSTAGSSAARGAARR
jgi:hypothetical protein